MIDALLPVLSTLFGAGIMYFALARALTFERARVAELYRLLEAKAAPQEFAAYLNAPTIDAPEYLFSEDGLVSVPVDEDDE